MCVFPLQAQHYSTGFSVLVNNNNNNNLDSNAATMTAVVVGRSTKGEGEILQPLRAS